jgi:hypothetical protein
MVREAAARCGEHLDASNHMQVITCSQHKQGKTQDVQQDNICINTPCAITPCHMCVLITTCHMCVCLPLCNKTTCAITTCHTRHVQQDTSHRQQHLQHQIKREEARKKRQRQERGGKREEARNKRGNKRIPPAMYHVRVFSYVYSHLFSSRLGRPFFG